MICEQWFPTPIWYGNFDSINETQYNNAIKYCKELAAMHPGRKISNDGGWQSNDFINTKGTPLEIFFNEIKPNVQQALLEFGITRNLNITNFWININYKNSKNYSHNHAGGSLSGVFYLTKKNSNIIFERERDISSYHISWLNSKKNTPLTYNIASYTPQQGQFLIFPSWIFHSVETNNTEEERISVAFNVGFL